MGTYLEDFLEKIRVLPSQVHRSFNLLRQLDEGAQTLTDEVRTMQREYLDGMRARVKGKPRDAATAELAEDEAALAALTAKRTSAIQLADEKIAVASQVYDVVDGYIRQLDTDLRAFEGSLRASGLFEELDVPDVEEPAPELDMEMLARAQALQRKAEARDRARKRERGRAAAPAPAPSELLTAVPVAEDLPVDPNEPTYCVCKRVSFGNMVGCENEDCPIEWFHYSCVGLTAEPKGKWYCPNCRETMDRKKARA